MKWLGLIAFVVQFYSVGGFLVAVAAGTRVLCEPKAWWRWAAAFALFGAAFDTVVRIMGGWVHCFWDEPLNFALYFALSGLGTIVLAAAARVLALFSLSAFTRVVLCLAIDFLLRFAIGIAWVLLQFTLFPECMK